MRGELAFLNLPSLPPSLCSSLPNFPPTSLVPSLLPFPPGWIHISLFICPPLSFSLHPLPIIVPTCFPFFSLFPFLPISFPSSVTSISTYYASLVFSTSFPSTFLHTFLSFSLFCLPYSFHKSHFFTVMQLSTLIKFKTLPYVPS